MSVVRESSLTSKPGVAHGRSANNFSGADHSPYSPSNRENPRPELPSNHGSKKKTLTAASFAGTGQHRAEGTSMNQMYDKPPMPFSSLATSENSQKSSVSTPTPQEWKQLMPQLAALIAVSKSLPTQSTGQSSNSSPRRMNLRKTPHDSSTTEMQTDVAPIPSTNSLIQFFESQKEDRSLRHGGGFPRPQAFQSQTRKSKLAIASGTQSVDLDILRVTETGEHLEKIKPSMDKASGGVPGTGNSKKMAFDQVSKPYSAGRIEDTNNITSKRGPAPLPPLPKTRKGYDVLEQDKEKTSTFRGHNALKQDKEKTSTFEGDKALEQDNEQNSTFKGPSVPEKDNRKTSAFKVHNAPEKDKEKTSTFKEHKALEQEKEKALTFTHAPAITSRKVIAGDIKMAEDTAIAKVHIPRSPGPQSQLSERPLISLLAVKNSSEKKDHLWIGRQYSHESVLDPRNRQPQLTAKSLANAIVASSLASSRASSPGKPAPPLSRHQSKAESIVRRNSSQEGVQSRTPSPGRVMRHTMRETPKPDKEESHKKSSFNILNRHPNKHHEGDRKRWQAEITEKERKRYEGVWATNRGLLVPSELPDSSSTVLDLVVRDIWSRSRLPDEVLAEVWDLVNISHVRRLSKEEFVVGMWLIDQKLKGRKLPMKVSESVWYSVRRLSGIKVRVHKSPARSFFDSIHSDLRISIQSFRNWSFNNLQLRSFRTR